MMHFVTLKPPFPKIRRILLRSLLVSSSLVFFLHALSLPFAQSSSGFSTSSPVNVSGRWLVMGTFRNSEGFTLQKRRVAILIMVAAFSNRIAVIPNWFPSFDAQQRTLEFNEVIDFEAMSSRLFSLVRLARSLPADFFHLRHRPPVATLAAVRSDTSPVVVCGYWADDSVLVREAGSFGVDLRRTVLGAFQLAPPLLFLSRTAQSMLLAPQSGSVCIHLRIEDDFRRFFHSPPGFYNLDQITSKIRGSGWNVRYPVAYLAGGDVSSPVLSALRSLFPLVLHKFSILALNRSSILSRLSFRQSLGNHLPQTILAALDQDVCEKASAFIGNNHSSWSEAVVDAFFYRGAGNETAQTNDMSPSVTGTLLSPFCSANAKLYHQYRCNYYRVR